MELDDKHLELMLEFHRDGDIVSLTLRYNTGREGLATRYGIRGTGISEEMAMMEIKPMIYDQFAKCYAKGEVPRCLAPDPDGESVCTSLDQEILNREIRFYVNLEIQRLESLVENIQIKIAERYEHLKVDFRYMLVSDTPSYALGFDMSNRHYEHPEESNVCIFEPGDTAEKHVDAFQEQIIRVSGRFASIDRDVIGSFCYSTQLDDPTPIKTD